ncbi:unnamed protein product [Gadus morhua 'NCC']
MSDSNVHSKVAKLGLTTAVPFEDYSAAVQACNLDIDMDGLYEEYARVEGCKKAQGSGGLEAMMTEGLWILSCYRGRQDSHLQSPLLPARKLNRSDGNMAFTITLTREEFLVILSDGSEVHFPNRLGACEYLDFSFDEGVLIRSFEIN